jgi:4-hydroxythreonine-4-phosphate dehydrogenase
MIRVGITLGDPAGVGPELIARALNARPLGPGRAALLIGSEPLFRAILSRAGGPALAYERLTDPDKAADREGLFFLSVGDESAEAIEGGRPSPASARQALAAIDAAVALALRGRLHALVTGPVAKKPIADLGADFPGHTEYLAAACAVRHPVMMFVAEPRDEPPARVAFVTTHVAIRKLPAAVTTDRVHRVIDAAARALRERFGIERPKIAVAGLNPHAGEMGMFGREERDVIEPAILLSRARGVDASGPYAADSIVRRAREEKHDAIVAMYHDQLLPLIKTVWPEAVNTTLGLPFVRTSPDHGPAYDKAGKGTADWRPTAAAIGLAARMAEHSPASVV